MLRLSFRLKDVSLAGKPREYDPHLAIWSTDREQMPGADAGRAVAVIPLDRNHEGVRSIEITDGLPIDADPHADLCITVYANTRETGCSDKLSPADRPNTIRVGQVNMHWFGLLKHLDKSKADALCVSAPVMSLAA